MTWLTLHTELFRLSGAPVTPASLLALVGSLAFAALAGRWVRSLTRRVFMRGGDEGTAYAVAQMAQYAVVILIVLVGLENFGLSLSSLAALGAFLSVGVGFGLQNIVQNFVSGIILLVERPVKRGDVVRTGETVGRVDQIALRATRLITRDGVAIIVPNSDLVTGRVVNLSAPTTVYRARVLVGVAYGSDTARVKETLLGVARRDPRVLEARPPEVYFREFGDSALGFELCVWLDDPFREPAVTSDLRFAIDAAFREAGIEIPFPQRDVHIKSEPASPGPA